MTTSETARSPHGERAVPLLPVPGGRVVLADRRTSRRWQVTVAPFLLSATAVTRSLYLGESGADVPMTGVSWLEAVRFCNTLSLRDGLTPAYLLAAHPAAADGPDVGWDTGADGYRLPTEAEWEHACRAGTSGPHYGPLDDIAWHRANSDGRIHPVATRAPNAWGLHDMLGNSWDWCWDLYDPEVYGPYRVLRGGGWFDEPWSCRASVRRRSHPTFQVDDVGFRLARSLPSVPGEPTDGVGESPGVERPADDQ